MKLISPQQRAKLQFRLELVTSALLATILVTTVVVISTPGYGAALSGLPVA